MKMTLFHYWRSTCSWRVRFVLAHKKIAVQYIPINLLNEESEDSKYLERNPMGYVPVLEIQEHGKTHLLTESTAIAEWLEEAAPTPALLPQDRFLRAQVRSLAQLINSGIQPLGNLTVTEKLTADQKAQKDPEIGKKWTKYWVEKGFHAYEKILEKTAGDFSVGNNLTLADVFLIPQCYSAQRNGVELSQFPILFRINEAVLKTEAAIASHPDRFKPES